MIENKGIVEKFERDFIKNSKLSINQVYEIAEGMLMEAIELKVFPPKDPLEGLNEKIDTLRRLRQCFGK